MRDAAGDIELFASGGGTRNATLMRALGNPRTSDALGLPAQDKEAYAFALLGYLTAIGAPGTVATCTGARHATVLGSLTPPGPTAATPTRLRVAG